MTERLLITGGAGFIGSSLALAAGELGYEVTLLDALSTQIHGEDPTSSPLVRRVVDEFELVRADVRDREAVRTAVAACDVIVHLAAETGTGQSMYDIDNYVSTNVQGTATILDLVSNGAAPACRKIVVASSRAIYGEGAAQCPEHGVVFPGPRAESDLAAGDFETKCPQCGRSTSLATTSETAPAHPISLYGVTKSTQEQLVMTTGAAIGVAPVALRYQNVYGPGQSLTNPYTGILSIFSTRLRNGNAIDVYEDGHESRDFVYIDDVVAATLAAISDPGADSQVFNVGSGVPTTVNDVVETIAAGLGLPANAQASGHFRVGDIRHNVADLEKVQNVLGFRPRIGFADGVAKFCEWVLEGDTPPDTYEQSVAELRARKMFK